MNPRRWGAAWGCSHLGFDAGALLFQLRAHFASGLWCFVALRARVDAEAIHEETQMNQPDDPESPGKINLPDIDQRNNQGSLFSPNNQKA